MRAPPPPPGPAPEVMEGNFWASPEIPLPLGREVPYCVAQCKRKNDRSFSHGMQMSPKGFECAAVPCLLSRPSSRVEVMKNLNLKEIMDTSSIHRVHRLCLEIAPKAQSKIRPNHLKGGRAGGGVGGWV